MITTQKERMKKAQQILEKEKEKLLDEKVKAQIIKIEIQKQIISKAKMKIQQEKMILQRLCLLDLNDVQVVGDFNRDYSSYILEIPSYVFKKEG